MGFFPALAPSPGSRSLFPSSADTPFDFAQGRLCPHKASPRTNAPPRQPVKPESPRLTKPPTKRRLSTNFSRETRTHVLLKMRNLNSRYQPILRSLWTARSRPDHPSSTSARRAIAGSPTARSLPGSRRNQRQSPRPFPFPVWLAPTATMLLGVCEIK